MNPWAWDGVEPCPGCEGHTICLPERFDGCYYNLYPQRYSLARRRQVGQPAPQDQSNYGFLSPGGTVPGGLQLGSAGESIPRIERRVRGRRRGTAQEAERTEQLDEEANADREANEGVPGGGDQEQPQQTADGLPINQNYLDALGEQDRGPPNSVYLCNHTGCISSMQVFNSIADLKTHARQHVPEKDRFWSCARCVQRFVFEEDIILHDLNYHRDERSQCPLCNKRFLSLAQHQFLNANCFRLAESHGHQSENPEASSSGQSSTFGDPSLLPGASLLTNIGHPFQGQQVASSGVLPGPARQSRLKSRSRPRLRPSQGYSPYGSPAALIRKSRSDRSLRQALSSQSIRESGGLDAETVEEAQTEQEGEEEGYNETNQEQQQAYLDSLPDYRQAIGLQPADLPRHTYVCLHLDCSHSNKIYAGFEHLKAHARNHVPFHSRPYACDGCTKRFVTASDLRRHAVQAHKPADFRCNTCGRAFQLIGQLARHQCPKAHGTEGQHNSAFGLVEQTLSGPSASSSQQIVSQERGDAEGAEDEDEDGDESEDEDGDEHPEQPEGSSTSFWLHNEYLQALGGQVRSDLPNSYICKHANCIPFRSRTFPSFDILAKHARTHIPVEDRPLGCSECSNRFFFEKSRVEHIRSAHRERKYECPVCWRTFETKSKLERHQKRKNPCTEVERRMTRPDLFPEEQPEASGSGSQRQAH